MKNIKLFTFLSVVALMGLVIAPVGAHALSVNASAKAQAKVKNVSIDADADADAENDWREYQDDERLPRGIRVAPGIEKRVDEDKGLPFGIFKRFFGFGDDDDEQEDHEEELRIIHRSITTLETKATLAFETNIESYGTFEYARTADLASSTEITLDLSEEHEVVLEELDADTTYYFKIVLHDEDDEETLETDVRSFTTDAPEDDDTVEIEVTDATITASTTEATIAFNTNVETRGTLTYADNADLTDATDVALALGDEHEVLLEALDEETTYYFMVALTTDDEEATFESSVRSFTTESSDTTAPNIMFYHVFNVDTDSAYVIWITSEQSDAQVWVDTDAEVDTSGEATVADTDFASFHVLQVTGLTADTAYYMQVASSDEAGNETLSDVLSFTTDAE